jgi:hypothetical protein
MHQGMKTYWRVQVFLTSGLVVEEWSASHLGHFDSGERASGTYWIGSRVGPGAGLQVLLLLGVES